MTSLFSSEIIPEQALERISKAAFALEIGVSKPRISQLVKQGLPLTDCGKVRRVEALAWYRENIAPNRRKAFSNGSSATAKNQLDALKIERERLALAKDRGHLIDRAIAGKTVFERARMERDAWLAFATRIAPKLALELDADPAQLYTALDREVREHLAALSQQKIEGLDHVE